MKIIQTDLFAQSATIEETIKKRLPTSDFVLVADVASALDITRGKVIELIEQGLIKAANLNVGTDHRAFYKITRESVLSYARMMDENC